MARRIQQFYIADNKPASNSARDLFEYCVEKAMEKDLFSEAYMHNQWANLLFGYEKNSSERTDLMSKVKGNTPHTLRIRQNTLSMRKK